MESVADILKALPREIRQIVSHLIVLSRRGVHYSNECFIKIILAGIWNMDVTGYTLGSIRAVIFCQQKVKLGKGLRLGKRGFFLLCFN